MLNKTLLLTLLCVSRLAGQLTVSVVDVTSTTVMISYSTTAPTCTIVGVNNTSGIPIYDLDPTLFTGADTDTLRTYTNGFQIPTIINGRVRTVGFGQHNVQSRLALDGRYKSLGLEANADYTFTITCGASIGSVKAKTSTIQQGNLYPEYPVVTRPGFLQQPTIDYTSTSQKYIDSTTGALLALMSRPSDILYAGGAALAQFTYALDRSGSAWTNPNNALTNRTAGTLATTTTTNAPLFLAWPNITPSCCQITLNDIQITLYGRGNAGTEVASVCLTQDSGQTCATDPLTIPFTSSVGVQGSKPNGYPTPFFSGWGVLKLPFGVYDIRNATYSGVSTSGNTVTLFTTGNYPPDSVGFNTDRKPGSKFKLSGCAGGVDGTFTIAVLGNPHSPSTITTVESLGTRTNCLYQDEGAGVIIKLNNSGTLNVSALYSTTWGSSSTSGSNAAKNICASTKVTDIVVDCDGHAQSPPVSGYMCQYSETGATEVYLVQDTGRICLQSILYNPAVSGSIHGLGSPWVSNKALLGSTSFDNHVWKATFTGTDYTEYVPGNTLPPANDHFTYTDITATSTPLSTQIQSYTNGNGVPKAAYNSGIFSPISISGGGVIGGYAQSTSATTGGDSPCLKVMSDQNGNLIQAVDSWSIYPLRGTVCHSSPVGVDTKYRIGGNPINRSNPSIGLGGPFMMPTYFILNNGNPAIYQLPAVTVTPGNPTTLTFASSTDLPLAASGPTYSRGSYIFCTGGTGGLNPLNGSWHITMNSQTVGTIPVSTSAGGGTVSCITSPPLLNTTVASVSSGSGSARITIGTPAGYTFFNPSNAHHLMDGQSVVFYGLSQNIPYFAKSSCSGCSSLQFEVYSDSTLTTPVLPITLVAATWVSQAEVCPTTDSIPGPIFFDSGHGGGIVRCVTFRMNTAPCSEYPALGEATAYPCPGNGAFSMLKQIEPGDTIYDGVHSMANGLSPDSNQNHERMLVLSVTGSPPNQDVVMMRWYGNDPAWGNDRHAGPNYDSYNAEHGPGWQPIWYLTIPAAYFDVTDTTNTPIPENPIYSTAHGDLGATNTGVSIAAPATGGYGDMFGSFTAVLAAEPIIYAGNLAYWANSFSLIPGGEILQTYPAHRQYTACLGLSSIQCPEQVWKTDSQAVNPSFGSGQGIANFTNMTRTVTLVSGQAYTFKITPPNGVVMDIKTLPYYMSVMRGQLKDISSPTTGNVMTDAQNGNYCIAYTANECRTGSSAGDVYFTFRGAWDDPGGQCFGNSQNIPVPCLFPGFTNAGWYEQIKQYAPFEGPGLRRITQVWNPIIGQFTFSSMSPTPDGKFGIISANPIGSNPQGDSANSQAWNVKLPPWAPDDNQFRGTWVQVPIPVSGKTGDTVRIRFGYPENGDPALGYCITRAEACYTSSTATPTNPFVFAGETQHKTSCGTGCTINIPAIPNRWLAYRIERTSASGMVTLGNLQWRAVK